ncbi:MAG: hypothetical protein JSU90_03950 [Nitrospiraceae bacterium]|nr:MAG: hypothetical protein JSU90_03950 [Nitrospiraceae bacterium]
MYHFNFETGELKDRLKNLFSLVYTKKEDPLLRDVNNVVVASMVLQISEFRLFQIAHVQWYGREIPESRLEYVFDDYLFEQRIPHYVRYFARKVIRLFDEGGLDPRDFNINHPAATPEDRAAGIGYTVMLALILIIFCLLLSNFSPYH